MPWTQESGHYSRVLRKEARIVVHTPANKRTRGASRGGSMSAIPSAERAVGGHGALHLLQDGCNAAAEFAAPASSGANKRKRRPAGTPDPDAEVVALSPKTLMESDRYVCEICNQGFQRDQNLQMHRRRHKVPWKLLKRPSLGTQKRVYVCPERSCLHHDPSHALGDLVGIKKHYRRKHCIEKQWKCDKCSKGYAVQSDYKAHLKTCGTRGHCCDCGRVFSRVESFIEHQDTCSAVKRKNMQSEGGSEKKSSLQQRTHRYSNDSQNSETTQAIPLARSGMSDTTARSVDSTRVVGEHPRRLERPIPTWLMERHNELQLLGPSKQQFPDSYSEALGSSAMDEIRRHQVGGSRSQVTRCSSMNSACPEVSCTDSKSLPPSLSSDDVNTPSLQLSIGPYSTEVASSSPLRDSTCIDTKPSLSSTVREVVASTHQQVQAARAAGEVSMIGIQIRENLNTALGKDLALSFQAGIGAQPGKKLTEDHHGEQSVSLNDFLMQAARRLGPPRSESGPDTSQGNQSEQQLRILPELGDNPYVGSTSTSHGERGTRPQEPEPDPFEMRTPRRGILQQSQFERATSMVTCKHALDQMDVAQTELFAASRTMDEAYRQKEMAAAACAEASQAREQARTDINTAWSDLAAARRTKEQARQESNEAQKELVRADLLKREAQEQLQLASAEKAYADHAREVAKRQMDMAEAELANAKRLREHAQAELEKAQFLKERAERSTNVNTSSQDHHLCHSCKTLCNFSSRPAQTNPLSQATPAPNSPWPRMSPPTLIDLQSTSAAGQLFLVPGSSFEATNYAENAKVHNRLLSHQLARPWSGTSAPPPVPVPSSDRSSRWPGSSSMPTYAVSMAIEGSPQGSPGDQSESSSHAIENQSSGSRTTTSSSLATQSEPLRNSKQLDLN